MAETNAGPFGFNLSAADKSLRIPPSLRLPVKAELVRIRIAQARRELVKRTDVNELLDSIAAITLTHLSGMSARCAPPGDVVTRRNIDAVVYQIRREISLAASAMADERGEPPDVMPMPSTLQPGLGPRDGGYYGHWPSLDRR